MAYPSATVRIQNALLSILAKQPHKAITVSELSRQAGVNRVTFYRLFGSLEAVILSLIDGFTEQHDAFVSEQPDDPDKNRLVIRTMIEDYLQYAPSLRILLESNYAPLLERSLEQRIRKPVRSYSARCGIENTPSELLITFCATGITHVICDWTRGGCKESIDELIELIIRSTMLFEL